MESMCFDGLRVTKHGLSVCRNTAKSDVAMQSPNHSIKADFYLNI